MRAAVYTQTDFIDDRMCRRIRDAMDTGTPEVAEVLGDVVERREEVRRAQSIDVDPLLLREVEASLEAQRDPIAAFHGVSLGAREGTGFLRYSDGGFYKPHRDRAAVPSWPGAARRRIAAIVFLNSASDGGADGEFTGGTLRLFFDDAPFDVQPRAGLLVAFAADVVHEVTVVRGGSRDVIVDWFYGGP
jgi:predicted 2-oxoglutarate/Fe(II)-dependent dioxygenase YbiX